MTNPIHNSLHDKFRGSLYPSEQPYYDAFVREYGRQPTSFVELTGYALAIQESNKQVQAFWGGVFGL